MSSPQSSSSLSTSSSSSSRARSIARLAFAAITTLFGELVAPSRCSACDESVSTRVLFCPACAVSVHRMDLHAHMRTRDKCVAAFEYGGAIATAIMRFKYSDRADLAPRLGLSMLPFVTPMQHLVDLVVPVPLHSKRLAERGYNQASLLAAPVAKALDLRLAARALIRVRHTRNQATLDRRERLVNLYGAFHVREPELIRGSRVLLVDDVRTTGTTLETCAAALHEAGARQVHALVLARA